MFSRNARVVLFLSTALAFSNAVSAVFVNMYLYRWLDGLAAITVFNLFQFALIPVGFVASAQLSRRAGKRLSIALGLALFVVFYGLLVVLGSRSAQLLYLIGAVNGLANGFFWFPFNIVLAEAVEESERGRFFGISGALSSAASAAGPLLATAAIELAPRPESGYEFIFLLIAALMAAMAAAAVSLRIRETGAPVRVLPHLRLGSDPGWRFAMLSNLIYGVRDGASWSIMSILVLQAAKSEDVAGELSVLFALFGIGANYLGGRMMTTRRSSAFWGWGSLAAVVSSIILVALPTVGGAAASGFVWKLAEALVFLPFNAAFFGILARYIKLEGDIAGRNIAVEIALNIGRALGAGLFLALSFVTADYAQILYPAVTLTVPASWLVYRRYLARRAAGMPAT
ncbi:MAG TPA: MFS transporter [Rectinemataceae bacterium]|nr:MFS transporter [Rectinemataceae bacterium]